MQTHTRQHRPSQMSTTLDTSSDEDDEDGASGDDGEPRGLNDAAATSPSHDGEGVSVIGLGASATTPGAAAGHFELPGSGSPPPPSTTTVESPTVPALPPRPVLSAAEGVSAFAAMWESDQFKASAAAPREGNTNTERRMVARPTPGLVPNLGPSVATGGYPAWSPLAEYVRGDFSDSQQPFVQYAQGTFSPGGSWTSQPRGRAVTAGSTTQGAAILAHETATTPAQPTGTSPPATTGVGVTTKVGGVVTPARGGRGGRSARGRRAVRGRRRMKAAAHAVRVATAGGRNSLRRAVLLKQAQVVNSPASDAGSPSTPEGSHGLRGQMLALQQRVEVMQRNSSFSSVDGDTTQSTVAPPPTPGDTTRTGSDNEDDEEVHTINTWADDPFFQQGAGASPRRDGGTVVPETASPATGVASEAGGASPKSLASHASQSFLDALQQQAEPESRCVRGRDFPRARARVCVCVAVACGLWLVAIGLGGQGNRSDTTLHINRSPSQAGTSSTALGRFQRASRTVVAANRLAAATSMANMERRALQALEGKAAAAPGDVGESPAQASAAASSAAQTPPAASTPNVADTSATTVTGSEPRPTVDTQPAAKAAPRISLRMAMAAKAAARHTKCVSGVCSYLL